MCTVLLPPGVNPIAVNKYIVSCHSTVVVRFPKSRTHFRTLSLAHLRTGVLSTFDHAVTLMTCIRKVPDLYLTWSTEYPEILRDFPQSLYVYWDRTYIQLGTRLFVEFSFFLFQ